METNLPASILPIIQDYLIYQERSQSFTRLKNASEKDYNRMVASHSSEGHHYDLEKAEIIYKAFINMNVYGEESVKAHHAFIEAEEKLRHIGEILFEPTIKGDIKIPAAEGREESTKSVTVSFKDGIVRVQLQ